MSKVKPLSPAGAIANKQNVIPDFVIEAFNFMITRNLNGRSSTVDYTESLRTVLRFRFKVI